MSIEHLAGFALSSRLAPAASRSLDTSRDMALSETYTRLHDYKDSMSSAMCSPSFVQVPFPPRSGVMMLGPAFSRATSIAFIIVSAASLNPKCSSIICPAQIIPIGLAIPFPAISGADP